MKRTSESNRDSNQPTQTTGCRVCWATLGKTEMDVDDILERVCERFMHDDRELLSSRAHERTVTHRIALYLQCLFPGWHVDCEYNRQGVDVDPKIDSSRKRRFPDIIIHRRGTNDNLLVIEAKPKWARSSSISKDREKLRRMVEAFGYRRAFLLFYSDGCDGKVWFEEQKAAQPGATDNPDDAQRSREDH